MIFYVSLHCANSLFNSAIPKDRYNVTQPVLLVAALRDAISIPSLSKANSEASCTNLTVHEFDTGHWVMLEKPDELNVVIEEYLKGLNL